MGGSTALKVRFDSRLAGWVAVVAGLLLASPTPAFEALDGRVQAHGFFEMQIRSIARDYELQDGWDLTQWYNVLNIEADFDIAPDGWGPFNLISAFTRIEARYDCVWTRGCGMFPSVNTFGDRAKRLPRRMNDGFRDGFSAQQPDRDLRSFSGIDSRQADYAFAFGNPNNFNNPVGNANVGDRDQLVRIFQVPGLEALFGNEGADGLLQGFDDPLNDDPALVAFGPLDDYEFGVRSVPGSQGGIGAQILGPLLPKNRIEPTGRLRNSPNPFRALLGGGALSGGAVAPAICAGTCVSAPGTAGGAGSGLRYREIPGLIDYVPVAPSFAVGVAQGRVDPDINPAKPVPVDVAGPAGDPSPMKNGIIYDGGSLGRDPDDLDALGNAPSVANKFFNLSIHGGPSGTPINNFQGPAAIEGTDLPFRPAPRFGNLANAPKHEAQGLFYPNARQAEFLRDDEFSSFDQNFRQEELAWNRGSSQQEEKELKELYFDIEAFDARLWARLGKQSIVWGKTELFRTTDQFNPQDVALATLPSLEESRIALWAGRFVWSFYDIGPLQDVRLEAAFNFDQFEPADLGRCGEPYTVFSACAVTTGLWGNGVTNAALAGIVKPPDPWNSLKGLEVGARAEFRWSRFSFAITDFYGYGDFPVVERLFTYERNVDPRTGRPRRANSRGRCNRTFTDDVDSAGLAPGVGDGFEDIGDPDCLGPHLDALQNHHANQSLFAVICSSSIGFSSLDPTVCAQSVLNSKGLVSGILVGPAVAALITGDRGILAQLMATQIGSGTPDAAIVAGLGNSPGARVINGVAGDINADGNTDLMDLPLVRIFNDGAICNAWDAAGRPVVGPLASIGADCLATVTALAPNGDPDGAAATEIILAGADFINGGAGFSTDPSNTGPISRGLRGKLTHEQEGLLGCGLFYGSLCDVDGIDLLNAEASFVLQSWPSFEGTFGVFGGDGLWQVDNNAVAQPGTAGFMGGTPCTRFEDGEWFILPGCNPQLGTPGNNLDNATDLAGWVRQRDGTSPSSDEAEQASVLLLKDTDGNGIISPAELAAPDPDPNGDGFTDLNDVSDFLRHPFACADPNDRRTCQIWVSEGSALSWNALMGFTALSAPDSIQASEAASILNTSFPAAEVVPLGSNAQERAVALMQRAVPDIDPNNCPLSLDVDIPTATVQVVLAGGANGCFRLAEIDELDVNDLYRTDGCSFIRPQLCSNVRALMSVSGVKRPTRRAGGNGRFGRRDFVWHDGSQAYIRYEKRNVFGFSMDFAEDVTKSNWSMEATWIEGLPETDNDEFDGLTDTDQYNLTISVDRPTFINFLNPNRTFFINSQWFFQYVKGYEKGFPGRGPWNFLFTFSVFTGYFQDRLNPAMTYVYDVRSNSGAILPEIEYRFSDKFSATVGFAFFFGRYDRRTFPINSIGGSGNHVGKGAYRSFVERGLSVVQDRDEAFLLLRYTF